MQAGNHGGEKGRQKDRLAIGQTDSKQAEKERRKQTGICTGKQEGEQ